MQGLKGVTEGVTKKPRRTMIYGVHGVGKTTWASQSPNPILIQCEEGANDIGTPRFNLCRKLEDVTWCISELMGTMSEDKHHDRDTLIIDSLDALENIINVSVCTEMGVEAIGDVEYGQGYGHSHIKWLELLDSIKLLSEKRNMNIILIAHSRVVEFKDPARDSYMRYTNALYTNAKGVGIGSFIQQWCDEVFFSTWKVSTRVTDKKVGREEVKAVGGGQRVIYTAERPSHDAKNRLGLTKDLAYEIPMDFAGGYNAVYGTKEV